MSSSFGKDHNSPLQVSKVIEKLEHNTLLLAKTIINSKYYSISVLTYYFLPNSFSVNNEPTTKINQLKMKSTEIICIPLKGEKFSFSFLKGTCN